MEKIIRISDKQENIDDRIRDEICSLMREGWEIKDFTTSITDKEFEKKGTSGYMIHEVWETDLFVLEKKDLLDKEVLTHEIEHSLN